MLEMGQQLFHIEMYDELEKGNGKIKGAMCSPLLVHTFLFVKYLRHRSLQTRKLDTLHVRHIICLNMY